MYIYINVCNQMNLVIIVIILINKYVFRYVYVLVYMYICRYIYIYIGIYVCIYNLHMYINTHTFIYITYANRQIQHYI